METKKVPIEVMDEVFLESLRELESGGVRASKLTQVQQDKLSRIINGKLESRGYAPIKAESNGTAGPSNLQSLDNETATRGHRFPVEG